MRRENTEHLPEFFKIELAGKKIEVNCLYRKVFNHCRDYLARFDTPDFEVGVTAEELASERQRAEREAQRENRPVTTYADDYLETLAVYREITQKLLDYDILMLHGAAIAVDGRCYLILADSGVGKTTHIRNWLKVIPGTVVINGDKPLIDMNTLEVYGTPWAGKEKYNTNTHARLAGLILLERGQSNTVEPLSFHGALPGLLAQCHIPDGEAERVYPLLGRFKQIPCYRLSCNMEPESALVACRAVHGDSRMK